MSLNFSFFYFREKILSKHAGFFFNVNVYKMFNCVCMTFKQFYYFGRRQIGKQMRKLIGPIYQFYYNEY